MNYLEIYLTRLFLLTSLATTMSTAISCQIPVTPEYCATVGGECADVTEANCTTSNGTFVRNGGICGNCDVCVKYVGMKQPCNYTESEDISENGILFTTLCSPPLVCTRQDSGVCVPPYACTVYYTALCGGTVKANTDCIYWPDR